MHRIGTPTKFIVFDFEEFKEFLGELDEFEVINCSNYDSSLTKYVVDDFGDVYAEKWALGSIQQECMTELIDNKKLIHGKIRVM